MEILRSKNKVNKTLFKREYNLIKGALYLGYGINLKNSKNDKKYRIVDIYKSSDMRSTHLICLGRTRWGKTRFIERAIVDDIESGFSIFHIDPKMDYDGLEAILDAVIRTERVDEFILFSPIYPEVSIRLNPFYQQIPDAVSDIIKAMSPSTKEDFFKEIAGELGKAVSTALYLEGQKEVRFVDIFQYTSVDEIEKLYLRIEKADDSGEITIGNTTLSKKQLKIDGLLAVKKLKDKDPTYWGKVNTTLELILSQLSTGLVGEVFGKASGNPLLEVMLEGKPFIFTAVLGSLYLGKDPASKVAKMVNAMHEKAYGFLYSKFGKLNPPISEYWDEGSVVIYDGAVEKINKVGGIGGYIHIFTQSFSDFKMNIGEERTKVFFDNADFMALSVIDYETAKYFSDASGTILKLRPMWDRINITAVPEMQPLIKPEYFMQMPKGAFHAFIEGSWYRGYSPMLLDRKRIIIEPLPYPEDRVVNWYAKKYNRSLQQASEEVRKYEITKDYDFIMKEKLADMWIDLKQFPYYQNYVVPRRTNADKIIEEIKVSKLESDLDKEKSYV